TSWLAPLPLTIGALTAAIAAYIAAVFLCADAVRQGDRALERAFRVRALAAGVGGRAAAVAGLVALHADAAPPLHPPRRPPAPRPVGAARRPGLAGGRAAPALGPSGAAGRRTVGPVRRRRYGPARASAALAVAAVVAGWALAQAPVLLPGLTVPEAAAPPDTL